MARALLVDRITYPMLLDAELIVYAVAFALGLLVAVYAMLNGTVRAGRAPGMVEPPHAAFNAPVVGAALVAFGAIGYLAAKYSQLGTISTLVVALIASAAGWIGMGVLMAKWALRGPLSDPHEDHEELQGTIATVTRAISPDAPGEISYSFRGAPLLAEARCVTGEPVPEGAEVVIEKVEGGVADVEPWAAVEQRI